MVKQSPGCMISWHSMLATRSVSLDHGTRHLHRGVPIYEALGVPRKSLLKSPRASRQRPNLEKCPHALLRKPVILIVCPLQHHISGIDL